MKLCNLVIFILFISFASGNLVSNVRVVNFADYIIEVITRTVKQLELKSWSNLKIADVSSDIDEVVLGWHANGTLHYKNGFIHSIQAVDIRRDTVQGAVTLNNDKQAQATVRGTLRLHDVAIGYDVEAVLADGTQRYTALYVHPLISFAFTIIKLVGTENYAVTVVGTVPTSTANRPQFRPRSKAADAFTTLFVRTLSDASIVAWGPDVFTPIAEEIVTSQVPFPRICYNCSA